jgi:MGT family glycosyltransferase
MPRRWDRAEAPVPPNTHHLRHVSVARPGQELPAWARELPGRPTVLAALGTIAHAMPGIFETILAGLAAEDVDLILAVGQDPERFGPQPPNVRIERYVPQTRLLERCDLLISHGGFNSVKEALAVGVPLVVVPIMSDEPYSAERVAALGLGRVVEPPSLTPDSIRAAVRAVLDDPGYRTAAATFRDEMLALPGPDRAVELLCGLAAGDRSPMSFSEPL